MINTVRVLHVEDDGQFADLAETFLQRELADVTIQHADDPTEGMELLAESAVDCIVSDYDMPDINGIEFLEAVREEYPDLPFILFTGKGSEEVAGEAISKGVTDYLQKESGTDQYTILANRIRNTVEQHQVRGELAGAREDEKDESKNWGRHGNLDLHGWAFDRFSNILEYKAKVEGIEVVEVSERDTSKTCCVCGREDDSQRVERGLYVCEDCDAAFNADVNAAANILHDINNRESNSESSASLDEDRSTGWLAQPGVYLHDLSRGFQPRTEVVDCKP